MIRIERDAGTNRDGDLEYTGLDVVYLVDRRHPAPGLRIGIAERQPGATLVLLERVSESVADAARQALADRDLDQQPERQTLAAPPEPPPETEPDD